ncbi:MAG: low molecular weight protein arginine phosphatase [Lentisphaeria bacterium]|nr:low molecular weight protein arginine phosphatase [Lentisphaeria bacterium]
MLILFVCTGNTCRSPLAEFYFNELCRRAGRRDVKAESAGVCAFNGGGISRESAFILRENGIPCDGFLSRCVTPAMVRDADLIVAMGASHKEALADAFPEAAPKLRLLMEFAGTPADVPDPYGGSAECYRSVFEQMKTPLEKLAESLFK